MAGFSELGFREAARLLRGRLDALSGNINDFEERVEAHRGIDTAQLKVVVKHEAQNVGDTLNTIPWMLALAVRYNREVHAGGEFNNAVKALLVEMPIKFGPIEGPGPNIEFVADVKASWEFSGPRNLHMLQGYFALSGMPLPTLPVSLPFMSAPCNLPAGVVISPFCGGEPQEPEGHVRVWYIQRWNALIEFLLSTGRTPCVYVIGGDRDDPTPFLRDGVVPVIGYPLSQVLDLMQRADLCITIDTGTSHLAHFGGVNRHLLLYPEVNFSTIHTNPRARMLRAWPADISADVVINEAARMIAEKG
jgi:hypothetical protein